MKAFACVTMLVLLISPSQSGKAIAASGESLERAAVGVIRMSLIARSTSCSIPRSKTQFDGMKPDVRIDAKMKLANEVRRLLVRVVNESKREEVSSEFPVSSDDCIVSKFEVLDPSGKNVCIAYGTRQGGILIDGSLFKGAGPQWYGELWKVLGVLVE